MALPKLNTPQYELELPSTGGKIKYRPFLVKEQKLLMMAQESENDDQISNTIISIINSCTDGKLDATKLPIFDVEYIFLQLRSKSVGEQIDLKYDPDCYEKCKALAEIKVDIKEIKVEKTKNHSSRIKLTKDVIVDLKYPKIDALAGLDSANQVDMVFGVVLDCIDKIYEGEETHNVTDYTKKELMEFLDSLNTEQFQQIQTFFDTMPKLRYHANWSCPKSGVEDVKVIEALNSFFELA